MSDLAQSLAGLGISIFVLCPHQSGLPMREEQGGVTIIRFPYWFTHSGQRLGETGGIMASLHHFPLSVIQLIPFCLCQFLIALRVTRNEKIDVIHTHWIVPQGFTGALLHAFTGIPHINSIHGTDIHLIHSHKAAAALVSLIAHYSEFITANSRYTFRLIRDLLPDYEKIQVIPMGIFPQRYVRKKQALSPQRMVLFIGRLIPLKGVDVLIKAFHLVRGMYPDSCLNIIGEGPFQEDLENLAVTLQLSSSTRFLGRKSREELSTWFQNASVFVLPSVTYSNQSEGLGVVLLEAMASGVPVIGSNSGGIPDIIEHEVNGLLIPPGDPRALAEAIMRFFEEPNLVKRCTEEGYKTVMDRFSWEGISERFIGLYQIMLNDDSKSHCHYSMKSNN